MDSPQYNLSLKLNKSTLSFKPYYKWIVLNTIVNLIENKKSKELSFKPYYKWIVLNTLQLVLLLLLDCL